MQFRRVPRTPASLPIGAACITWVPIAIGIIAGTLARATVFVFGGRLHGAAAASIVCAGLGATLASLWFLTSTEEDDPRWTITVSGIWVLLSLAFRALWLGGVLGGGWSAITEDYRVWEGQPGLIVLGLVAAAPLLLKGLARRP